MVKFINKLFEKNKKTATTPLPFSCIAVLVCLWQHAECACVYSYFPHSIFIKQ